MRVCPNANAAGKFQAAEPEQVTSSSKKKIKTKYRWWDSFYKIHFILFYFVNETCSAPGPDSQPFPLLPCRPDDGPLQAKLDQQNQLHHCGPDQTSIRKMRSKASRKMSSFLPQTIILRVVWLYWCVIDDPLVTGWRKKKHFVLLCKSENDNNNKKLS